MALEKGAAQREPLETESRSAKLVAKALAFLLVIAPKCSNRKALAKSEDCRLKHQTMCRTVGRRIRRTEAPARICRSRVSAAVGATGAHCSTCPQLSRSIRFSSNFLTKIVFNTETDPSSPSIWHGDLFQYARNRVRAAGACQPLPSVRPALCRATRVEDKGS
jgi:hypothetical protein